jgi:hypothetical protein
MPDYDARHRFAVSIAPMIGLSLNGGAIGERTIVEQSIG